MLFHQGLVPIDPTPVFDIPQGPGVPVFCGDLPYHMLLAPRLAPHMGKAEERKRGAVRDRVVLSSRLSDTKVDQARLVRVQA